MKRLFVFGILCLFAINLKAQTVDYSVVSVDQEKGTNFTKVTNDNDYVCMPAVVRDRRGINWLSNRIIDISMDGKSLAYLSYRNNTTNIFIKDVNKMGGSMQRTNRQNVLDFSYSPDGSNICFSETVGNVNRIFVTDAVKGYICRQITDNDKDYTPVYSYDKKQIYFARQESNGTSVWCYNVKDNFLSSISKGMNPCPLKNENAILCVRPSSEGNYEIWKVNYDNGVEECIVADINHSFTTPSISPDGQWILFVGSGIIDAGDFIYRNTDIYVCKTDGTELTQLTYHAADDISPVWSRDGKFIYFISQRGSSTGTANIWRMNFILSE